MCDPMNCSLPGSSVRFSRQETEVGSPSLLQWVFLTQGLNQGLLHCKCILYHLSHPVVKIKGLWWDHSGSRWDYLCPTSSDKCSGIRRKDTETLRLREGHVKTEAELGEIRLQLRGHLGPLEAGRGKEGAFLELSGDVQSCWHFELPFSSPEHGENKFLFFQAIKFVVIYLWQSQEMNTYII